MLTEKLNIYTTAIELKKGIWVAYLILFLVKKCN